MHHIHLKFSDPFSHAAEEEICFRRRGRGESFFLTYINAPSVHIGRHQHPGFEYDPEYCRSHGIPLLRRISGGGAVYHDSGVLNYAFAVPGNILQPSDCVTAICSCLDGILSRKTTLCSRKSIWLEGRKTGGTAFALAGGRLLVHGCLLVNADLEELSKALTPETVPPPDFPRALQSVSSPVINLNSILPEITAEKLGRLLHRGIQKLLPGPHDRLSCVPGPITACEQKFRSAAWQCRS